MTKISAEMKKLGQQAKEAAAVLARLSVMEKNVGLIAMADSLEAHQQDILAANEQDIVLARESGLAEPLVERLTINAERVKGMADNIRKIASLDDPLAVTANEWVIENGLRIGRRRVPLGVVAIIYESRPNVTADASALTLKSGNAIILRGGKEALNSNLAIEKALKLGLENTKVPLHAVQVIPSSDRLYSNELMTMNDYVDCLIPRGGRNLIQTVVKNATVPVIETGEGNDHLYIEQSADVEMAKKILLNAKVQRPSVCNAVETVLIDRTFAEAHLQELMQALLEKEVELRGDAYTVDQIPAIKSVTEEDWDTEFLSLVLAVKVVSGYDEAITHIRTYSTKHSEAIVTSNYQAAQNFLNDIDAAAVYVNASTRFTDGEVFGFGGEMGISTQKLHARGPLGLEALTSYKYVIQGEGQIRE